MERGISRRNGVLICASRIARSAHNDSGSPQNVCGRGAALSAFYVGVAGGIVMGANWEYLVWKKCILNILIITPAAPRNTWVYQLPFSNFLSTHIRTSWRFCQPLFLRTMRHICKLLFQPSSFFVKPGLSCGKLQNSLHICNAAPQRHQRPYIEAIARR